MSDGRSGGWSPFLSSSTRDIEDSDLAISRGRWRCSSAPLREQGVLQPARARPARRLPVLGPGAVRARAADGRPRRARSGACGRGDVRARVGRPRQARQPRRVGGGTPLAQRAARGSRQVAQREVGAELGARPGSSPPSRTARRRRGTAAARSSREAVEHVDDPGQRSRGGGGEGRRRPGARCRPARRGRARACEAPSWITSHPSASRKSATMRAPSACSSPGVPADDGEPAVARRHPHARAELVEQLLGRPPSRSAPRRR